MTFFSRGSIDFFLCVLCGPKMTCLVWTSIDFFFACVVEIEFVFVSEHHN